MRSNQRSFWLIVGLFCVLLATSGLMSSCKPSRSPVDSDMVKMRHQIQGETFRRRSWWQILIAQRKKEKSYENNEPGPIGEKINKKNKRGLMWRPIWKKDPRQGEVKSLTKHKTKKKKLILFGINKSKRDSKADWYKEKVTPGTLWSRFRNKGRYNVSKRTKRHHKDNNYF